MGGKRVTIQRSDIGKIYYFLTEEDFSGDRLLRDLLPGGKKITIRPGILAEIKYREGKPDAYILRGADGMHEGVNDLYATSPDAAEAQRIAYALLMEEEGIS